MIRTSSIGIAGGVLFLGVYSAVKYAAAAPPVFSSDYVKSVATLVLLTGIAPMLVAWFAVRMTPLGLIGRLIAGAIVGIASCVGAYALYFQLYVAGAAPGVEIIDVAKRGVGWGALIGAIAALAASKR